MNYNKKVGFVKFFFFVDYEIVLDVVFVRMKMFFYWKKKMKVMNWFFLKIWDLYLCIKILINKLKRIYMFYMVNKFF